MVTGATGFVGRHVVRALLRRGHSVIAVARNLNKAQELDWFEKVKFIAWDLHERCHDLLNLADRPDALIHLAWPGLPNYQAAFHLTENLPADLLFLRTAVNCGISEIIVAGTCLEYGFQSGPLTEEMETRPSTPYGIAKDTLRKSIGYLQQEMPFAFKWVRMFYMYGEGQNEKSLLSQLDLAINSGSEVFNMSIGTQMRDYLSIEKVAENFVDVLESSTVAGVINCCSGTPIAVADLVESRAKARGVNISFNKGYYKIPDYEPLEFWGVSRYFKDQLPAQSSTDTSRKEGAVDV
jgi:dTDP-6-deoxy-L-talose 4-dehydrogenase (NAD+)